MKITNYGHASVGVKVSNKDLLFDPFISPNELAAHISVKEIPADYILISHGHEDHVFDVETIARRTKAKVISNFEIVTWFEKKGLENNHPMNVGGKYCFDFGVIKMVRADHSSMLPDRSYGGNPAGFVVTAEGKSFYYAGDTAFYSDMKLIGEYAPIDLAFLPMGDNFTMGIEDALKAAKAVDCKKVIGIHYDTFGYIRMNHEYAKTVFAANGIELFLPNIGETIDVI